MMESSYYAKLNVPFYLSYVERNVLANQEKSNVLFLDV